MNVASILTWGATISTAKKDFFKSFFYWLPSDRPRATILACARAVFSSRGSLPNFFGKILGILPIVFYPEIVYYNNCQGER